MTWLSSFSDFVFVVVYFNCNNLLVGDFTDLNKYSFLARAHNKEGLRGFCHRQEYIAKLNSNDT